MIYSVSMYLSMAAHSRFTASRRETSTSCTPAAERLPPPPSCSSSTWTFTSPMLRAETATPPPSGVQADSPTPPPLPPPPGAVPAPWADSAFSWAVWLLLLLILVAAALIFRWQYTSPARRAKAASQEQDRFDLWLADVLLRLSAAGYTRPKGETLMTFTRRLDAEGKLPVSLGALGECASLLHYGRVHALETDTALAREASLKLRTSLPRQARLRYALLRLKPGRRDAVRG